MQRVVSVCKVRTNALPRDENMKKVRGDRGPKIMMNVLLKKCSAVIEIQMKCSSLVEYILHVKCNVFNNFHLTGLCFYLSLSVWMSAYVSIHVSIHTFSASTPPFHSPACLPPSHLHVKAEPSTIKPSGHVGPTHRALTLPHFYLLPDLKISTIKPHPDPHHALTLQFCPSPTCAPPYTHQPENPLQPATDQPAPCHHLGTKQPSYSSPVPS